MKNNKSIILIPAVISILLPLLSFASQVNVSQLQTFTNAVSATNSSELNNIGLVSYIFGFYDFALIIAGILAMGAIIYGAILYAISSGNTSRQSDAKEWITQALLGLLLLLAANLLLGTINPKIISPSINIPKLESITPIAPSSTQGNVSIYCSKCTSSTINQDCYDDKSNLYGYCIGNGISASSPVIYCNSCTPSSTAYCYDPNIGNYRPCSTNK
jgi:hypothetical protein